MPRTNDRFYSCIEDPSLIYILGVWPSLDAHQRFLASPARDEVLGGQEDLLDFQWTVHMALDDIESLPLRAPVLAIARLFIKADCTDAYGRAVERLRQTIVDATKPYNVVDGWRLDSETGMHEALVFTGWENAQAHAAFTAKARGDTEYAGVRQFYEAMEVRHARNLEGTAT